MKIFNQHILQAVNVEVNTTSEPKAFELKSKIDSFLKENLFPEVGHLLDQLASSEEIKRFNSINLEIIMKSTESFRTIIDQFVRQLRQKIAEAESELEVQKKSGLSRSKMPFVEKQPDMQDTFLYFLNSGRLPWYASPSILNEFTQPEMFNASLQDKLFVHKIEQLFISIPNALERLVHQFDAEIIEGLIFQLSEGKNINREELLTKISRHSQNLKYLLYKLVINGLIGSKHQLAEVNYQYLYSEMGIGNKSVRSGRKLIGEIYEILSLSNPDTKSIKDFADFINQAPVLTESDLLQLDQGKITGDQNTKLGSDLVSKSNDEQAIKNIDLKAVYIQNAGLILAHPFLWDFLTQTNCTDGSSQLLPEKKQKAVHLLHYLASGQEQEMEYNLTFEKFLCGIPLDSPVNRRFAISEQDKNECDDLLRSIIRHWPVLKNTSPDGLRQMFFQRNGKLNLQKAPFKLNVERKAQDILLEQLQWNISIVKLPWLNDLLFIEW
jgi:hypothetical protein